MIKMELIMLYWHFARNGINSFKAPNNFSFEEEFFRTYKSDTQIGYVYQENSVSQILSNLDLFPKIMYHLEYSYKKELFNKNIFNSPANYLSLIHKEEEFTMSLRL